MIASWGGRALILVFGLTLAACQGATRDAGSSRSSGTAIERSAPGSSGSDTAPSGDLNDACSLIRQNSGWNDALRRSSGRWNSEPHVTLAIIWQESRFQPRAQNPNSSAFGYPQAVNSTWAWYKDATGNSDGRRDNFTDAVDFVGWYTARSRSVNDISMSDALRQYLAYHEGHGGYANSSWRRKPWLLEVARRVDAQAETYKDQLRRCR